MERVQEKLKLWITSFRASIVPIVLQKWCLCVSHRHEEMSSVPQGAVLEPHQRPLPAQDRDLPGLWGTTGIHIGFGSTLAGWSGCPGSWVSWQGVPSLWLFWLETYQMSSMRPSSSPLKCCNYNTAPLFLTYISLCMCLFACTYMYVCWMHMHVEIIEYHQILFLNHFPKLMFLIKFIYAFWCVYACV
jgi:hypothetical protein